MTQDDAARAGAPGASIDRGTTTPTKRRKHIYPPEAQMAAEQAASADRASAAPVPAASPKRRKHIYPPAARMAAEQALSTARVADVSARANGAPTPVMAVPTAPARGWADEAPAVSAIDAEPEQETDDDLEPGIDDDGASLSADRVDVRGGAVGRVDAGEVTVAAGAIGAARADSVSVDRGALGAAMASDVQVSRGYARSILARQVQIDRGAARMIVAADVRAERTAILVLLARRVSGDVRVLLDWRGALAFGAVAGVIGGLIARSRRG